MARRAARREPGGRPRQAPGRGRAPLRPLAARRGLPVSSPGRAREDDVSEQARRVQEQFGASAAAYVTSAGHAGGDDLERLLAWGRQLAPARVLGVAPGPGHTALAFAGIARRVVAYDLTEPMLAVARGFVASQGAATVASVAGGVEALP